MQNEYNTARLPFVNVQQPVQIRHTEQGSALHQPRRFGRQLPHYLTEEGISINKGRQVISQRSPPPPSAHLSPPRPGLPERLRRGDCERRRRTGERVRPLETERRPRSGLRERLRPEGGDRSRERDRVRLSRRDCLSRSVVASMISCAGMRPSKA